MEEEEEEEEEEKRSEGGRPLNEIYGAEVEMAILENRMGARGEYWQRYMQWWDGFVEMGYGLIHNSRDHLGVDTPDDEP